MTVHTNHSRLMKELLIPYAFTDNLFHHAWAGAPIAWGMWGQNQQAEMLEEEKWSSSTIACMEAIARLQLAAVLLIKSVK